MNIAEARAQALERRIDDLERRLKAIEEYFTIGTVNGREEEEEDE